jgi:RimJ/RimL family protein N-acetyltransferase
METLEDVIAFLKTDLFKYVVHLKMLDAFAGEMRWYGEPGGVALLLPTAVNPYDAHTYPDSDWIVFLAASDDETAGRLVQRLPRRERLVFKLVDDLTQTAVLRDFPARRVTGFVSYTLREAAFPFDPDVMVSRELDARLLPCFEANGYTRPELERCFSQGSLSFSRFAADTGVPLATCFVFKNYEQIWEIGGVHTVPAYRRQGLARCVVAAAARELLSQGRIPRYQVKETNLASIGLAENLGMRPFVTTQHFEYMPAA